MEKYSPMEIGKQHCLEYISAMTGIPARSENKRFGEPPESVDEMTDIRYWENKIEIYKLPLFISLLEAESIDTLNVGNLTIYYYIHKPTRQYKPEELYLPFELLKEMKIYTTNLGFKLSLLGEYSDRFRILDSSGNLVELTEGEEKYFKKNRKSILRGCGLEQHE